MQTPPPLPVKRPDWWSRNWKWFVPVVCLGSVLVVAGFLSLISGLMRSSDAYKGAVARAIAHPAVVEAVGAPIQEGLLPSGNIKVSGSSGRADLTISIEGPKGKATIYVGARKADGAWHYDTLIVQIADDGRRLDLSER